VKVLICHELLVVREGLRSVLMAEPDIDVIDATGDGNRAMALASRHRPDVLITGTGLDLIRRAGGLAAAPRIVAFSMGDDLAPEALRAGAIGVLAEDECREQIIATVRAAERGQTSLTPAIAQRLVDWFRQLDTPPARLTDRQRQVLLLIAQGRSTEEVAHELFIEVSTVRTHLFRLRSKLNLRDRGQLVSFAYRTGLMTYREHADAS
jgi:DNA-binding NarL/FixJ family response regulator